MVIFLVLLLLSSTPSEELYIQSSDGGVVKCVDKYKQPAFTENDLLKHHKIQEVPYEIPKAKEMQEKNIWHTSEANVATANCPVRTVPIQQNGVILGNQTNPKTNTGGDFTRHEYAGAHTSNPQKFYGTKAVINVWDPKVEGITNELSIAQIWITLGGYKTNDLNTIEAGWEVCPGLYNDAKPRLFVYWTSNGYNGTGGYNLQKPGFVQISNNIVLGGVITPASTFDGNQYEITVTVWKDRKSGNWWLSLGPTNSLVGYWPAEIFTSLADHATKVTWGGEIVNSHSFDRHTKTQMGSGFFPEKGFGKAAYFRNLRTIDENNSFKSIQQFDTLAEGTYYKIEILHTDEGDNYFFYGGPGFSRTNRVVPLRLTWVFIYFLFMFFLII